MTFVNEFSCLRNLRITTLTFLKATTDPPPSCWLQRQPLHGWCHALSLQHIHQHLNRWAFHQGNSVLLNNPQRRRLPTPSVQIYRRQQLWFGSQLLLTTNFGVPQGCVSSPYLFSLQIEVGGDTLVLGLNKDELAQRNTVHNTHLLNGNKTVMPVVDMAIGLRAIKRVNRTTKS